MQIFKGRVRITFLQAMVELRICTLCRLHGGEEEDMSVKLAVKKSVE